jgi:hypothetical protein
LDCRYKRFRGSRIDCGWMTPALRMLASIDDASMDDTKIDDDIIDDASTDDTNIDDGMLLSAYPPLFANVNISIFLILICLW